MSPTTTFQLFTLDFKRMTTDHGTAVRISNGAPRWKLKYPLVHSIKELHPAWADVKAKMPSDQFEERYHAKLNEVGLDVIASRFRAVAVAENEPRLVLLCFDDLAKPGGSCHRTMFARWWTNLTGETVTELGPTGPAAVPNTDAGLF
jgi:hypothetical protein